MEQDNKPTMSFNSEEEIFSFSFDPSQVSILAKHIEINGRFNDSQFSISKEFHDFDFENAFNNNFTIPNLSINLDEQKEEYIPLYSISTKENQTEEDIESMPYLPLFVKKILRQKEKGIEDLEPEYFKLDSYIKHWKVTISEYTTWKMDLLVKKVAPNLNKPLFKIPEKITKNTNYVYNFDLLFSKIKDIGIIKPQLNQIIKKASPEIVKEINKILEFTYEEAIKAFYDDKKIFGIFRNSKLTQFYEKWFKKFKNSKEENPSLDNYGFLQFIKFESCPKSKADQELIGRKRKILNKDEFYCY